MNRKKKHVCIVGLGHFGAGLARSLAPHCEVLTLDLDMNRVQGIADQVHRSLNLDARDYQALSAVVPADLDEAVVAIGRDLEASILCTLHLRRIGVPIIRAKANSDDHAEILRSVGATEVVYPERETAERLALHMVNPNLLDFVPVAADHRVVELPAPPAFHGRSLRSLELRSRFGLFALAIKRQGDGAFELIPGPDRVVEPADILVVIARQEDLATLHDTLASQPSSPPSTT